MALAQGGRVGFAAAALFLLSPRGFYVLEHGWTEPFVVMLLAATVFCACRRPRWTPLMLGLLLFSKQYIFIALPAMLLLAPRPWASRALLAILDHRHSSHRIGRDAAHGIVERA